MRQSVVMLTMLCVLAGAVVGSAYGERSTPAGAEQFVLSGVLVDGERGMAWLLEPTLTQNRVVAVRPGDSVGPYRLTAILDDRVEMEGPAGKILVPLYTAGLATSLKAVASVTPPGPASTPAREASAATPASVASVEPAGSAQPPRGQSFQQSVKQQTTQPGIPAAKSNDLAGGDFPLSGGNSPEGNPSPPPPSAVSLSSITPQTFAPPEPLQHLQQALELTRETSAIVEPGPSTSQPSAASRRVYGMGDPHLRGALRSLLGGQ